MYWVSLEAGTVKCCNPARNTSETRNVSFLPWPVACWRKIICWTLSADTFLLIPLLEWSYHQEKWWTCERNQYRRSGLNAFDFDFCEATKQFCDGRLCVVGQRFRYVVAIYRDTTIAAVQQAAGGCATRSDLQGLWLYDCKQTLVELSVQWVVINLQRFMICVASWSPPTLDPTDPTGCRLLWVVEGRVESSVTSTFWFPTRAFLLLDH